MKKIATITSILGILIIALLYTKNTIPSHLLTAQAISSGVSLDPYDSREDLIDPYDLREVVTTTKPKKKSSKRPVVLGDEVITSSQNNTEDYRVNGNTSSETKKFILQTSKYNCFKEYIKPGSLSNNPKEVSQWQDFLNNYMNTNLEITGTYNVATQNAVHNFQQKHFEYIINPWVPPLRPRTTGYIYKTTRSMANYIIGCPETDVFLEDPAQWYSHKKLDIKLK